MAIPRYVFEICLHISSPARNYFLPHASHGEHVFLIAHHDLFGYVLLILKDKDAVDLNYSTATLVSNIEQQGVLDISLGSHRTATFVLGFTLEIELMVLLLMEPTCDSLFGVVYLSSVSHGALVLKK